MPARIPEQTADHRQLAHGSGLCRIERREKLGRHLFDAEAVDNDSRVPAAHRLVVERAGEAFERRHRARVEVTAHEWNGEVAREETAVVDQQPQVEAFQLAVGRVRIGHVDCTTAQRLVREAVLDTGRAQGQSVCREQPGPAIGAFQELVAEAGAQLGVSDEL